MGRLSSSAGGGYCTFARAQKLLQARCRVFEGYAILRIIRSPLILVKGSSINLADTEMMNVRWCFFHLWKQIPPTEQQNLTPCGHCFAKLILEHK